MAKIEQVFGVDRVLCIERGIPGEILSAVLNCGCNTLASCDFRKATQCHWGLVSFLYVSSAHSNQAEYFFQYLLLVLYFNSMSACVYIYDHNFSIRFPALTLQFLRIASEEPKRWFR